MKKLLLMAGLVLMVSACSDRKGASDAVQQQRDSLHSSSATLCKPSSMPKTAN